MLQISLYQPDCIPSMRATQFQQIWVTAFPVEICPRHERATKRIEAESLKAHMLPSLLLLNYVQEPLLSSPGRIQKLEPR